MKFAIVAVAASSVALLASPLLAQTEASESPIPGLSGYSQPEIGPDACKVVNPGYTECTIPAKTAGRYLVEAAGTSVAEGEGATQSLAIGGKTWLCAKVTNTAKWSSGPRTFHIVCTVDVLTDEPLAIAAAYDDTNATKSAKGPTLIIHRMPWNGVLSSSYRGAK